MPSYKQSIVGSSGFVGTTLATQTIFDGAFARANASDLEHAHSELLVCAAAPAQKWIANRDPETDLKNIEELASNLKKTSANKAVLISTVDVFGDPVAVDEESIPDPGQASHYGRNRLWLEEFFSSTFPSSCIIRLPALVGPGLRKNAIFDLKHGNQVNALNPASKFQFYPTRHLWRDIQVAIGNSISVLHLTAEPLSLRRVSDHLGIGGLSPNEIDAVNYDLRSRFSSTWGSRNHYQYSAEASLDAILDYVQS